MKRPTDDDLRAFLDGALPDERAEEIARLLDAQPLLATRARQLDPLHALLTSVPEPASDPALIDAVLEAVGEAPAPRGLHPITVGVCLLAAGILLAVAGTDPLGALFDVLAALAAATRLTASVPPLLVTALGLPLALLVLVAGSGIALTVSRRSS